MLRLIKNNNPFTVITLFIFTLLVKFNVLVHPLLPVPIHNHFVYNTILKAATSVFAQFIYGYCFFVVANLFLQSIYIVNIISRHKLFHKVSYVPSYTYIILTSIFPVFNVFSETFIINWLLIGAMDVMFYFSQTNQPRKMIFNAGFLICVAALFQVTFLVFFLLLLVSMVMFRPFNLGEWSVALMGFLTPIYFFFGVLYLADKFLLIHQWLHIGFSLLPATHSSLFLFIILFGLFLLLSAGYYALQLNVAMSNIYVRRNWIVVSFYLIIALLAGFTTDSTISSAWLITIPPLSIIISHAFVLEKHKRFSNFIFYFSLLYVFFCLWANH